jgi:hypothetical protein
MNPVADGRGWPRHVISFLEEKCLVRPSNNYDGVMLDCLSSAPMFGIDANRDGKRDQRDTEQWREAYLWMLQELRRRHPHILLIGNAGQPLSARDPYLHWLNGSMHENALGNQWGTGEWRQVWDGYRAAVSGSEKQGRETMHFIMVDVRMDRSLEEARQLDHLTATDLRRMRLGLCTSLLLDGGYFGFDRGDCLHGQLWWFDEYDADIGAPVERHRNGAWGAGIYSRQYDRGLVIVNTHDKPVTVNLRVAHFDYTTKKIAQKHVMPPGDGRILRAEGGEQ